MEKRNIENIEMEKASLYNELRGQVYDKLIRDSQNLDKEHLLELFELTLQQIKTQDMQLFDLIYKSDIEKLGPNDIAKSYRDITETHIKMIDGIGDRIISNNDQVNTQQPINPDMVLNEKIF